jgi:hypothetical protein
MRLRALTRRTTVPYDMRHGDLLLLFTTALSSAAAIPGCSSHAIPGTSCPATSVTVPLAQLTASDGGASADAGPPKVGDSLDLSMCVSLCSNTGTEFCSVTSIQGNQATVECHTPCIGGRRPAGYRARQAPASTLVGEHFAGMAALEAASVVAFRRLSGELSRNRAPRALVRGCLRAARDEIRHARNTSALARRYGAVPLGGDIEPEAPRSLEALEGCVRETFGALVAHWQAHEAGDPVVRAVMKRIARDETRHAALSWAIDAWARSRLDRAARDRVTAARTAAARALVSAPATPTGKIPASLPGLPSRAQGSALAKSLQAAWARP